MVQVLVQVPVRCEVLVLVVVRVCRQGGGSKEKGKQDTHRKDKMSSSTSGREGERGDGHYTR